MYLSSLLLLTSQILVADAKSPRCRCQPTDLCWPSPSDWNGLNNTIQGNLLAVRPIAHVCHGADYNETACQAVQTSWHDSSWRISQPGAVQWPNYESWPEKNQSCYPQNPKETPCGQGRVSLYSAVVKSVADVQAAVKFAKKHDIRIAIRNSGHGFLGGSVAPNSLQIFTHWMKSMEFVNNFVPEGSRWPSPSRGEGSAVTIAAGVNLKELYEAAVSRNVTLVAGTSSTVGAAGGYIQGGGHSLLGHFKGFASDNALEFRVVTADGSYVTANQFRNPDLYWALRGGGGGTFGVVTSVTIRVFTEIPVTFNIVNITSIAGNSKYWDALTELHASLPAWNDNGGTGYYFITPFDPASDVAYSRLTVVFCFVNQTDVGKMNELFKPFVDKVKVMEGIDLTYQGAFSPSFANIMNIFLASGKDYTGYPSVLGSRLYSRNLFTTKDGPRRLTTAIASLKFSADSATTITGHVVSGGAGISNQKVDSALNPSWRQTLLHLAFGRTWAFNATSQEQQAIQTNLTEVEIPILQSVEGKHRMGAYLNEANAHEPNFQESFWGGNYPRLNQIKKKWDPTGLFIVRRGVGSEDWDDDGLCRVHD